MYGYRVVIRSQLPWREVVMWWCVVSVGVYREVLAVECIGSSTCSHCISHCRDDAVCSVVSQIVFMLCPLV